MPGSWQIGQMTNDEVRLMNTTNTTSIALLAILTFMPLAASADSGFYLGGSVGAATLDEDFDGLGIDTDSTSFRLTAGLQFNDFFAIEGGYHSFGKFRDKVDIGGLVNDLSIQADGFTLGANVSLPVSDSVSLFGRAGAFFWDGDAEINNISLARPEDDNLFYGAGADVMVTERLSLIGDWTRYELEDTESDVISLGFRYRF
jgi:OOP family OmpA-OmpF porin